MFTKANNNYSSMTNRRYLQYSNNPPVKWTTNVVREKVSLTGLEGTEPGFNLTKEEIIKFKIWPQGIIPYYIDDFSFGKVFWFSMVTSIAAKNKAQNNFRYLLIVNDILRSSFILYRI